jgi:mono/diheme cytochrome c family protein
MREQIHVLEKGKLKTCEIGRESRMPAYDSKTLSDSEVQDIIAYLVSVSVK